MGFSKVLPSTETHVALSGLFSMGSRNHGFTPVYTRGYNLSPHSGFVRGTDDEELFENWDRW